MIQNISIAALQRVIVSYLPPPPDVGPCSIAELERPSVTSPGISILSSSSSSKGDDGFDCRFGTDEDDVV